MGGVCSIHGMDTKFWSKSLKQKDTEVVDVDGGMILEWILGK
jgi:hypothetical protein